VTPEEKAVIDAAIEWRHVAGRDVDQSIPGVSPTGDLKGVVDALIFSCPECNAGGHTCPGDGNPISHTATDCGEHEEETPSNAGRAWGKPKQVGDGQMISDWVPTTLLYALAGDRLRIGQDETDVLRSSSGAWHANVISSVLPSGKVWDKIHPWEHRELRLELSANPGFRHYPEDHSCEILMSAERRAVHLLMSAFPGSTVLDSPQAEK
jgi:hypothetical protein